MRLERVEGGALRFGASWEVGEPRLADCSWSCGRLAPGILRSVNERHLVLLLLPLL
jgi:hypothetical protein